MRLGISGLLVMLVVASAAAELARAQTLPYPVPGTAKLAWDHPGATPAAPLARFELQVDAAAWADLGVPAAGNAAVCGEAPKPLCTYEAPVPAMTPGPHVLRLRACNAAGCSSPAELALVVLVAPVTPGQLRIVIGGGE